MAFGLGFGLPRRLGGGGTPPSPSAPVNVVAPEVYGSATVGGLLLCSPGTWTGYPPPTFTYQWQQDTVDIVGATSNSYTVQSGDAGKSIRCVVTGTNASGAASVNSNAVTIPAPPSSGASLDFSDAANSQYMALVSVGGL